MFQLIFEPSEALLEMGEHVTVTVRATDELGNQNLCRFQVVLRRKQTSNFVAAIYVHCTTYKKRIKRFCMAP